MKDGQSDLFRWLMEGRRSSPFLYDWMKKSRVEEKGEISKRPIMTLFLVGSQWGSNPRLNLCRGCRTFPSRLVSTKSTGDYFALRPEHML